MIYVLAAVLGVLAGVLAGLFGVGGGILFVPVLVAIGLTQHEASGTSLLAILPTVLAGTWTQQRYGNVRWRAAAVIGVAAAVAAQGGVFLAEALPTLPRSLQAETQAALRDCVARIERSQGADGSYSKDGWAPLLSSAFAASSLHAAATAGAGASSSHWRSRSPTRPVG